MATHRPEDVHSDRISVAPHEAETGHRSLHLPSWALPLLGLLSLGAGALTVVRMVGQDDQGGHGGVSQASNTEAVVPAGTVTLDKPAPAPAPVDEADEDSPLPNALPFDEYVAKQTLELRARGMTCGQPGRVDLAMTFAPSGLSTRAEVNVTQKPGLSRCVAQNFEKITIPAFQGTEERTVRVSLAVR